MGRADGCCDMASFLGLEARDSIGAVLEGPVDAPYSASDVASITQLDLAIQRLVDDTCPSDVSAPVARFGSAF
jgi:hypothetical protein